MNLEGMEDKMKIFEFQRIDFTAKIPVVIFYLPAETREQAEEKLAQEGFGGAEFVKELTRDQFYREFGATL